jgi:hypothetical protein
MVSVLGTELFAQKLAENNLTALRIALNIGKLLASRLREANKKITGYTASSASGAVRRVRSLR